LKRSLILILLLCLGLPSLAQKLNLSLIANSVSENKRIDSIGYNHKVDNAKAIVTEINLMSSTLSEMGYMEVEVLENKKINDTTYSCVFNLGVQTKFIHIYIGENATLKSLSEFKTKTDTLILPYPEIENFLNQTLNQLENKGYALAKLKLRNIKKEKKELFADLELQIERQRQVNDIVIRGYDKFPKAHLINLKRIYKNQVFSKDNLRKIKNDFDKFRFARQLKYPEILFQKDSTKIYVYLEKAKSNRFDGFIGFSNETNNKIALNGYLDLTLINTLNSGEQLNVFWKSDGSAQKTFDMAIEIPYIFKSPISVKAQLNIIKVDSSFQNTKTAIDLGYYFNYNSRIYLGYQATESSDIQQLNNSSISDFNNQFLTSHYEYTQIESDNILFPEKTRINFKLGTGSRASNSKTDKQVFTAFDLKYNFNLNAKNSINFRSQNYYLQSNSYITNELYRFGGINSIRGFSENSLQANLFTSVLTEYRYTLSPTLYLHTIIDYGYFQDKTTNRQGNLLGLGIGFGILTKNGLLNIVYANGSNKEQSINSANSIVQISFKTQF